MAKKVPIDLNEGSLDAFFTLDEKTGERVADENLGALRTAVKTAREQAANLVAMESTGLDHIRMRQAAMKSAERLATSLDAAHAKVTANIEQMERTTFAPQPPSDAYRVQADFQICARLAAMPDSQRRDEITRANGAGNLTVLGAVLRNEPFLSGISPARMDVLRHNYRKRFHTAQYEHGKRLKKALATFEDKGKLFATFVKQYTDAPAAALEEANQQRREELLAAHLKEA